MCSNTDSLPARLRNLRARIHHAEAESLMDEAAAELERRLSDWTACHALLRRVEAERDALAAWSCDRCGARFAEPVHSRELLTGVTRCSSCMEGIVLAGEVARLRRAEVDNQKMRTASQELIRLAENPVYDHWADWVKWLKGAAAALRSALAPADGRE